MINHARTLLLNRDGAGFHGHAGEEYTDPTFHAVELPSFCNNVRRVLFGQQPDALMYMYRAHELMQMLHATELEQFVLDLDPRITYSFDNTSRPFDEVFPFQRGAYGSTEITQLSGEGSLFPLSTFDAPDNTGRCAHQWQIEQTPTQHKITHESTPRKFVLEDAIFTDGLSNITPLPESSLQFRAEESSGSSWRLVSYARPRKGLGDLEAAMNNLTEETTTSLFRVGQPQGNQEPWKTFRNLWKDHNQTAYRLGAIVLALIYHTQEIWDVG